MISLSGASQTLSAFFCISTHVRPFVPVTWADGAFERQTPSRDVGGGHRSRDVYHYLCVTPRHCRLLCGRENRAPVVCRPPRSAHATLIAPSAWSTFSVAAVAGCSLVFCSAAIVVVIGNARRQCSAVQGDARQCVALTRCVACFVFSCFRVARVVCCVRFEVIVIFVASPKVVPGEVVVDRPTDSTYPTRVGVTVVLAIMAAASVGIIIPTYCCVALRASRLQTDHHPPWSGAGPIH